jgi:hypothetical protein
LNTAFFTRQGSSFATRQGACPSPGNNNRIPGTFKKPDVFVSVEGTLRAHQRPVPVIHAFNPVNYNLHINVAIMSFNTPGLPGFIFLNQAEYIIPLYFMPAQFPIPEIPV